MENDVASNAMPRRVCSSSRDSGGKNAPLHGDSRRVAVDGGGFEDTTRTEHPGKGSFQGLC